MANTETLLQGREYTTGKECLPCAITAGDMLNKARSADFNAERSAFFMPSGSGPCRFGMYNCLHRLILKQAGIKGVPIVAPNQDRRFYEQLKPAGRTAGAFARSVWTAAVGIDLLNKVLLKVRPFAFEAEKAQQIYRQCLDEWCRAVERNENFGRMKQLMRSFADAFASVPVDTSVQKPLIGIVGEIYVRSHTFANQDIVGKLEALGACCSVAPLAEWIYYINHLALNGKSWPGRWRDYIINKVQYKIEKTLAEQMTGRFGSLVEEPISHTIALAGPYIHPSFTGEAILSVGKIIEFHHSGYDGVVNVFPFSCMPSTIVSTIATRLSRDLDDFTILNMSFDGQEDASIQTRLEAFVEHIQQNENARVGKIS